MVIERHAIRALLLTPEREILLMRIRPPGAKDGFWVAPGGGLEAGETIETGLRRELLEEVGLAQFQLGPLVWRRQHTFNWGGKRYCQREHYHIVDVARFEPRMSDPVEAKVMDCFRWWPVAELATTKDRLTPISIARILADYFAHGAPVKEPKLEVLVD